MQNYNGPILRLQPIFEKNPSDKNLVEKIKDKLHRIYPRPFQIDGELAEDIDSDLEELKTRIEAKNRPPMQRAWALQNIELLHQFLSQKKDPDWRDRGMADNLLWILRNNPGSKAVVWAHNGHINCLKQVDILHRSMGGAFSKKVSATITEPSDSSDTKVRTRPGKTDCNPLNFPKRIPAHSNTCSDSWTNRCLFWT